MMIKPLVSIKLDTGICTKPVNEFFRKQCIWCIWFHPQAGGNSMKMKSRNLYIFVVLVIGFVLIHYPSDLLACGDSNNDGGMGYFMFGGSSIDLSDLNRHLTRNGYSEFSERMYAIGGGGHFVVGDFVIGGQGFGIIARDVSSGDFNLSLESGYGTFDLGYIIWSPGHFKIFPMIGVGYGGMELKIVERWPSAPFDEVLENPRRNVTLQTGGMVLDFSLATTYTIDFSDDEDSEGGFILGVRAGYTLFPFKSDWKMDEINVPEGPEVGITGPYFHVLIGFGGFDTD